MLQRFTEVANRISVLLDRLTRGKATLLAYKTVLNYSAIPCQSLVSKPRFLLEVSILFF